MHIIKKSFRLISVLLILSAIILTCGCSVFSGFDSITISYVESYENTANEYRVFDSQKAVKAVSSEAAELYFDKESGAVALLSRYTSKEWTSVPLFSNTFASSFVVSVLYEDTLYYLDTSSCSAENGGISYKSTDSGIEVVYALKNEKVTVSLPVEFSLSGSYLDVSCDISLCSISENAKLISVEFLPYLGAVRYDADSIDYSVFGDYFLVPDGVGALMYTAVEDGISSRVFSVYGKDYYEESVPSYIGAYGIMQSGSALCVTVTEGEENALIKTYRAGADSQNINRIYPEFIITPLSGNYGKVKAGKSYNGKIGVSYEVLSEKDASYTEIASSVRQALIRNGFLPSEKCENEYPLYVSLVASTDGTKKNTVTSFQQAENLLSILKGKGINEINMVLLGAFEDGLEASAGDRLTFASSVGKLQDIEALLSYADSQQLNVFAGINLLTDKASLSVKKSISGEAKQTETTNPLSPYVGDDVFTLKYLGAAGISEGTKNILSFVDKNSFSGVCITDSYVSCYEESSSENGLYTGYSEALNGNLAALSAEAKLMLQGAGMNIIGNADYIYDVTFESYTENTGSYITVPFIPSVLHGSVIYSGTAANLSSVSKIQLLKSVEYGAVQQYLWVFSDSSDKYYEAELNDAVEFYLEARETLGDLSSKRITEHFMYESGVYCTGYEGGVRVYVNYNNYSVIIGEVSVMPYNYLRIG